MIGMERLSHFRFWCQKVLPLVYDNSLSYYEVLCKLTEHINELIDGVDVTLEAVENMAGDIDEIKAELEKITEGDFAFIYQIVANAIKNVFFGLTMNGYFVAYIPESWEDITFETTGWDVDIASQPEYGHLVLSY